MMQPWFEQAKLGIFIHWGIYAVDGTAESWAFYNNEVSYDDYMAQAQRFTAANYHPDEWADCFKKRKPIMPCSPRNITMAWRSGTPKPTIAR